MPDYGTLPAERLETPGPHLAPLYPLLPWEFSGARLTRLLFEIDLGVARSLLLPSLSRPTPPFGVLSVLDVPAGPLGPFHLAAQGVACRYGTHARVLAVQAVTDSPVALAAFREVWGYPVRPGRVEVDGGPETQRGTVADPAGTPLAEWTLAGLEGADPSRINLESELCTRVPPRFRDAGPVDDPVLVQLDWAHVLRAPQRGRPAVRFPGSADDNPWSLLSPTHPIIGITAGTDATLAPAHYVLGLTG